MPRSAGVTTSAVIVFIGSAFSILCGAMMVLMSVFSMYSSREAESAGLNLHYILAVESVFFLGLAAGALLPASGSSRRNSGPGFRCWFTPRFWCSFRFLRR